MPAYHKDQLGGRAMLERTAALKILVAVGLLAGIAVFPVSLRAQERANATVQAGQSSAKAKTSSAGAAANKISRPSSQPSEAQLAMRERRVKCGAEWRAAK